jgi:UDP-glucuronate 4-epimerase
MKNIILVTGCAGFIGFHISKKLAKKKIKVIGIDNINSYYSTKIKKDRISELKKFKSFTFFKFSLTNHKKLDAITKKFKPKFIIHLAAQPGVRYSIKNPMAYVKSNLIAFTNILEVCRHNSIKHLIYASSSSVYGASKSQPYKENDSASHPLAFYGATKRANELMAHSYSYLYNLPTTGLRFFTVYGPWGRPDMALFLFVKNIFNRKPINIFNYGNHIRDFTFIDDIVEGIYKTIFKIPTKTKNNNFKDPSTSTAPFEILNIGNNHPTTLMEYIEEIERQLGKKAIKNFMPLQKGDIGSTFANKNKLFKAIKFTPKTSVRSGIKKFINWYLDYYKLN